MFIQTQKANIPWLTKFSSIPNLIWKWDKNIDRFNMISLFRAWNIADKRWKGVKSAIIFNVHEWTNIQLATKNVPPPPDCMLTSALKDAEMADGYNDTNWLSAARTWWTREVCKYCTIIKAGKPEKGEISKDLIQEAEYLSRNCSIFTYLTVDHVPLAVRQLVCDMIIRQLLCNFQCWRHHAYREGIQFFVSASIIGRIWKRITHTILPVRQPAYNFGQAPVRTVSISLYITR